MYSPATSLKTRVKNSLVRPPVSCPSPKNSTYKNLTFLVTIAKIACSNINQKRKTKNLQATAPVSLYLVNCHALVLQDHYTWIFLAGEKLILVVLFIASFMQYPLLITNVKLSFLLRNLCRFWIISLQLEMKSSNVSFKMRLLNT